MYIDFTVINELNEGVQIAKCNILQHNHWVLAWGTLQGVVVLVFVEKKREIIKPIETLMIALPLTVLENKDCKQTRQHGVPSDFFHHKQVSRLQSPHRHVDFQMQKLYYFDNCSIADKSAEYQPF